MARQHEWTNLQGHELSCTATDLAAWKQVIHTVAYPHLMRSA